MIRRGARLSGSGAEVEPDDRREDLLRSEMAQWDPRRKLIADIGRGKDQEDMVQDEEGEKTPGRQGDDSP